MDDDNPAAYKKAPGDEGAKTKTSKHTKRFKQIFGEASCADMRVRKRPHMALEKSGTVKFDKRFKMYRSKNEINENDEELNEELVNLIMDLDNFVMSEEFDALMESDPSEGLKKKAEKTGISYGILKKVFDRGVAAWRTGHRPGTTPTQWGFARVNSFATKGKGTWGKADKDLAAKVRKEDFNENEQTERVKERIRAEKERDKKKHDRMLDAAQMKDLGTKLKNEGSKDPSDREWGTDSLTKTYKRDTPGESLKEQSPLMKHLPRGTRVSFTYKTVTGPSEDVVGTVVGTETYSPEGSSDVVSSRGRLRVRDDSGKSYTVKHQDVEIVE
jgi:hypothetical protein